tara:strand:- start:325 stop:639 length:315 start_codon:yes stop_codon:yes gene_type:complete
MAYIKFARNQSNEAAEMLLNVDHIITMSSSGATNLVIKSGTYIKDDNVVKYTLQVAATGGATLTRPNIVQKVIDTIQKAGVDGGNAPQVPDMEVQLVTIAAGTL